MAYPTVPQWDKGVSRMSLSNFDRAARYLTERNVANDQFRADVAKMGGLDKYRQALVDYEKSYLKYQIDFAKEDGKLGTLSDKYETAINSGLFSPSEVKSFQTEVNKLAPLVAEQQRKADADRIAKEQRRARIEAADPIYKQLNEQFQAQNTALRDRFVAERDAAQQAVRDAYKADYDRITDLYNSGQINKQQRDIAFEQALKTESDAIQTIGANYTALSKQISDLYDQNVQYATDIKNDIVAGNKSAAQNYAIITPPKGFGLTETLYQTAPITAVENLPELQPEVDPYAGMTIQEYMAAKRAEAEGRMQLGPQPVVETRSADDIFADILAEQGPTRPMGEGPGGLTLDQSEEIAKVLTAFTGVGEVTDLEGKPYDNPIEVLANRIYNEGYQSVVDDMLEQGGVLPVPGNYIDRAVAEDFAKTMLERNNFNLTNLASWANNVQANGFEGAAQAFKEANGKENYFLPSITDVVAEDGSPLTIKGNIQDFIDRNNTAIKTLQDTAAEKIDDAILRVNAGLPALPTVPEGMTTQEVLDQIYASSNFSLSPELKENLVGYADKFGADTALAYLDLLVNPANAPGKDVSIYQPDTDIFGTNATDAFLPEREVTLGTGTAYPEIPGTVSPTEDAGVRGVPTVGVESGLPSLASASTLPTGGVPTGGITTYQPAPYTPPPLLAAAPERPTLNPNLEFIGAPGIDRGVPTPMEALTAQQAGSQFVSPTQEDYYAFFGYTPEQLNAAQYLAELEGAPRAGVAAQTVPVIPTAVAGAPAGMKEGGTPRAAAQGLAGLGRGEDTMLIHMSPQEIAGLQSLAQQMGASLTINPHTGLPEADVFNKIGKVIKRYAPEIATVAMYAAGVPLPTAALLSGGAHAIGSGSLEEGIVRGISSYGIGSAAATGMQMAGYTPTPAWPSGGAAVGAEVSLAPSPGDLDYISAVDKSLVGKATDYLMTVPSTVPSNFDEFAKQAFMPAMMGESGRQQISAQKAHDEYMASMGLTAAQIEEENRKRAREGREAFDRTLGQVPLQYARAGGLMSLAGGGVSYAEGGGTNGSTNEPRMVVGAGDGMSDSVPATIEGVQEARLANDEFVIPADVVADLGNGSSSAGAKQLYAMMDRVRQARHGTTKQPPEVDVMKLMPA